jgi:hypothetical protein
MLCYCLPQLTKQNICYFSDKGYKKAFLRPLDKEKNISTECFTDSGKLNFPMVVRFRLEPIFNTAPAASKMMLDLKVVKIDSKISNSLH